MRAPWIIGSGALALAACTQVHEQLVDLTGDEARATCIELAGMNAIEQSSPLGVDLFLKLAYNGLSCYLLPAEPGVPSEVAVLPATAPPPPQALEIAPPPEVEALIQDEI